MVSEACRIEPATSASIAQYMESSYCATMTQVCSTQYTSECQKTTDTAHSTENSHLAINTLSQCYRNCGKIPVTDLAKIVLIYKLN